MSICIVVPMKPPARAKQRLSAALAPAQREALALSLFTHTLTFFQRHFAALDVLVVSEDAAILALCRQHGCYALQQQSDGDLNDAATEAAAWVAARGYQGLLIVPSDIAVLSVAEIETLLSQASANRVVIAVAKDGGTNALLACPAEAINFKFGAQSALAHQRECARRGLSVTPLTLPHLALDIDQLSDLQRAARQRSPALEYWQYA